VSVLTLCGVLSTIGAGVILRNIQAIRAMAARTDATFVMLVMYGLALSLLSGASMAVRRRDTVIVTLASTVIWGIFVEGHRLLMLRFLVFAALIIVGIQLGRWMLSASTRAARIAMGTVFPGVLCGLGGLIYYAVLDLLEYENVDLGGGPLGGLVWGLALGLAVGLGVSVGSEFLECMVNRRRQS
jgi:hypothetical protein